MAGRYIPPHMRGTSKSSTPSDGQTQIPERDTSKGYTYDEISNQFDCRAKLGTLNSAGRDGDDGTVQESLSFIIIFKDQHPEWPPKIFCKSNLNLLPPTSDPGIEVTTQTSALNDSGIAAPIVQSSESPVIPVIQVDLKHGPPIAIFSQIQTRPPRFLYDGVRCIKSITYLQPGSPELIDTLYMKFGPERKERAPDSWQSSLSMKWAVVEMGELEEGKNPMVPLKKMKDEKSVTEMLQEMRIKDSMQPQEGGGEGIKMIEEKLDGEKL